MKRSEPFEMPRPHAPLTPPTARPDISVSDPVGVGVAGRAPGAALEAANLRIAPLRQLIRAMADDDDKRMRGTPAPSTRSPVPASPDTGRQAAIEVSNPRGGRERERRTTNRAQG